MKRSDDMRDLKTRLDDLSRFHTKAGPQTVIDKAAVSLADERGNRGRAKSPLSGRRLFVAAAIATLGAVMIPLAMGLLDSRTDAPIGASDTASTVITTAVAPDAEASTLTMTWQTTTRFDSVSGEADVFDFAAAMDVAVMVGWEPDGTRFDGVIWYSIDRVKWQEVADPDGLLTGTPDENGVDGAQGITGVIRHANRFLAWGFLHCTAGTHFDCPVALLESTDGIEWQLIETNGLGAMMNIGGDGVFRIFDLDDRLIAFGASDPAGTPGAWQSQDGVSWTSVTGFEPGQPAVVADVAAGPTGFVAVGSVGTRYVDLRPAVWVSSDALTWSRLTDETEAGTDAQVEIDATHPGKVEMTGVVAEPTGWIAFGRDGFGISGRPGGGYERTDVAIWVSQDGTHWQRVHSETFSPGVAFVSDVATDGDRVVMIGNQISFDDTAGSVAAVWISQDGGSTWVRDNAYSPQFGDLQEGPGGAASMGEFLAQEDGVFTVLGRNEGDYVLWQGQWDE
jgi:hypothetical protein